MRRVDRALGRGDAEGAWRMLEVHVLHEGADPEAALAYWQLADTVGRSRDAVPVLWRWMWGAFRAGERAAVVERWREVCERVPDAAPPLDLQVRIAECLAEDGQSSAAETLLRGALARLDSRTAAETLLVLATNAEIAKEALARASAHPALPAGARGELERLARESTPASS
jgi:hypothetical protein